MSLSVAEALIDHALDLNLLDEYWSHRQDTFLIYRYWELKLKHGVPVLLQGRLPPGFNRPDLFSMIFISIGISKDLNVNDHRLL